MKNYYIEENSIIIEWANDKNGRCQAYSIYEDDILLKSNIPINNSKINVDELHHNHGKLTLKCDSFVKQKREAKDDGVEVLSSEENSDEESDTDDDSIINAIDNFFFPSDENEDKENESSNIIEKVFKLNDKVNNNDNEIKSDTKTGNKNNNDNESDEGKDKNRMKRVLIMMKRNRISRKTLMTIKIPVKILIVMRMTKLKKKMIQKKIINLFILVLVFPYHFY